MSAPNSPTQARPASRDTGFPEPFNGDRNTTLPHPDANLSPNARISQDDIAVAKVLHRTRRSFMAKHKRTISHGFLDPQSEMMYSEVVDEAGEEALLEHDAEGSQSPSAGRPSKDGADSLSSDGGSVRSRQRRRGFFKKLGFHHHK